MTTDDLLRRLTNACHASAIVKSYAVEEIDDDIMSVRVFLSNSSFVSAFYNLATEKVAFAWIQEGKRRYGKDNAKMGWHTHPFEDPSEHRHCEPVDFVTFLREIEDYLNQESQNG